MKLTIIGTGGMVPTKKTNPSAFLLEAGGKRILLDCGYGAMRRMAELGIDLQSIDAVCVTHFHGDHAGEAFGLINVRLVDDQHRTFARNGSLQRLRHKHLVMIGPKTLERRFEAWRKIFWLEPNEQYPVAWREGIGTSKIGPISITTFPVAHVPYFDSVGFIITHQGKRLVYTGDIGSSHPFADLVDKLKGVDLLMIEGSWVKHRSPNHFSMAQVEELAQAANVKTVLVVHTNPENRKTVKRYLCGKKQFLFAELGMKVTV
ncbi:hypothetical protein A2477_03985 [Candidatus Falkowbacteria bacterium RIFOXYC2_FULL_47_12]|uniref:Metallo-beta-lactamase domain-containing protein n=2 Tax=Candidatus Falkowiibacteriota TaxID=1752728 RepID=A0A1F5TNR4_9BACT|nr:MAG: hypothetical protein A2242_04585 [Candidatus Falkowbacteria bacterium RIFOXYA2_FULL_47_9]OGF40635.1 MAG: hypothetical protein A2477_03985 [Candidatus Falkowbacteria bacterium RIFOXYC2_FULL_47_12]